MKLLGKNIFSRDIKSLRIYCVFFLIIVLIYSLKSIYNNDSINSNPNRVERFSKNVTKKTSSSVDRSQHSESKIRLTEIQSKIRKSNPAIGKENLLKILQQYIYGAQPNLKELYNVVREYETQTGQVINPSWIGPYAEIQSQEFEDLAKSGLLSDSLLQEGIKYLARDHPATAFECIRNCQKPQILFNEILPRYLDVDSKRASELVISLREDQRFDFDTNAKIVAEWLSSKGYFNEAKFWQQAVK